MIYITEIQSKVIYNSFLLFNILDFLFSIISQFVSISFILRSFILYLHIVCFLFTERRKTKYKVD